MTIMQQPECLYWQELAFQEADRAFDAGEWSAGLQEPLANQPCGMCATCQASESDVEAP